jgi:hypothetical protein
MLRQMLINELEEQWGRSTELSKMAGYSNGSSLKKALKKEEGDIEKFDGFVRLVHELFPDNKFDLMTAFAKTLNPQKLTARFMLEYAALYNLDELKTYLIEQLGNSTNKESNDWSFVYGIDEKLIKREISEYEAINKLSTHKYNCPEMKVYSKIVQFYCYYDMRNFYMMEALYQDIQNEIEEIKKQFVKDSYYARLFLIECAVNLHSKNIGELREKLFLIENALDPIKVVAYLQVGNSYVLTNYEKANKLFNKANELTPEKYKTQIKKSMNFNNILWDKIDQYIEDGDKSNKLFYYAKTGQIERGLELAENINLYSYTEQQKGFHFFYMGLLLNDKSMFYKSVEHFNKCGEKFYKTLPILELKKAGESSYILDALSA